jgi:hypothetical protein
MENTKTPSTINIGGAQAAPQFTHDQLIAALYYIWDAFDRANMRWFLVGDTAQLVTKNKDLVGDGIDVGIRLMEWRSGSKNIFDSFIGDPDMEEEDLVTYIHNKVPIRLHIYEPDDECIIATNPLMYRNENFSVPNPPERFEEIYHTEYTG